MRSKPIKLISNLQCLMADILRHPVIAKNRELTSRIQSLNDECESLKKDGRGSHWKNYRESQQFMVSVRGQGSYVISGVEKMAEDLGWKISTLRSKLSMSGGSFSMERVKPSGECEIVLVARLKSTISPE